MIIFLCVIAFLMVLRLWMDHRLLKVTFYENVSAKIPSSFDGYKILQLSDLHGRNFTKKIPQIIAKQKPDIIVMTGDMVSANQKHYEPFFQLAEKLVQDYPVYYIIGNHEGRMQPETVQKIEETLRSYGVVVLDNERVVLTKDGKRIHLYGMLIEQKFYVKPHVKGFAQMTKQVIVHQLGEKEKSTYTVLLTHSPKFLEAYADWGADLILTGHIHGGMIRLPWLRGVFSPYREWFPQYDYGQFERHHSKMIVSGGLSRGETGFRLFNRPEIVVVTLHTKNK